MLGCWTVFSWYNKKFWFYIYHHFYRIIILLFLSFFARPKKNLLSRRFFFPKVFLFISRVFKLSAKWGVWTPQTRGAPGALPRKNVGKIKFRNVVLKADYKGFCTKRIWNITWSFCWSRRKEGWQSACPVRSNRLAPRGRLTWRRISQPTDQFATKLKSKGFYKPGN